MTMVRRLAPLILLFFILTAGWWIVPADVQKVPLCFFKYLTGFDCPGCGLTRSFLSLARGHFLSAFRYNAAGPFIYLLFLGTFVEWGARQVKPEFRWRPAAWVPRFYGILVVGFLFGHWILRLKYQWAHVF